MSEIHSTPVPSPGPEAGGARVAILTGASSGIGAHLARELSRRGWRVGLLARRTHLLQALSEELPGSAIASADVTDGPATRAAIGSLQEALGPCDLLVANAGIGLFTPSWRFDPDVAIRVARTNYEGTIHAVSAVLPGMLERGRGHLAVTSSVAGYRGLPLLNVYSGSKAAVSRFMEGLRVELAPKGIRVSIIHPGFVDTDLVKNNKIPLPFLMSPQDVARKAADGLEKGRDEINMPWPMVWLMGVARITPNFLYDPVVRSMFLGKRKKRS